MKNIINIDDFYDLYYKIQQQGFHVITRRLGVSQKSIVKRVWDKNSNPPINWWLVPKVVERWNKLISNNYMYDILKLNSIKVADLREIAEGLKIKKVDTIASLTKKVLKKEHLLYPAAIKKIYN